MKTLLSFAAALYIAIATVAAAQTVEFVVPDNRATIDRLTSVARQKYGILRHDMMYPLGWSRRGQLAYIQESFSPAVPETAFRLFVQDMVMDHIQYQGIGWSAEEAESSGSTLPDLGIKEKGSIDYYFAYKHSEIAKVLKLFGIETGGITLVPFPCQTKDGEITTQIELRPLTISGTGTPSLIMDLDMRLRAVKSSTSKVIAAERQENAFIFGMESIGYLKSPFEDRIAIIVAVYSWGIENDNYVRYRVYGCAIAAGFR